MNVAIIWGDWDVQDYEQRTQTTRSYYSSTTISAIRTVCFIFKDDFSAETITREIALDFCKSKQVPHHISQTWAGWQPEVIVTSSRYLSPPQHPALRPNPRRGTFLHHANKMKRKSRNQTERGTANYDPPGTRMHAKWTATTGQTPPHSNVTTLRAHTGDQG